MASEQLKIKISSEVTQDIQKMGDDLLAAKEALSEERIRAIVREELDSWQKELTNRIRVLGRRVC